MKSLGSQKILGSFFDVQGVARSGQGREIQYQTRVELL